MTKNNFNKINHKKKKKNPFDFMKSISINNNGEIEQDTENKNENDYKKMNITKLRSIVLERNLNNDPSKLKKPELIKLLDI